MTKILNNLNKAFLKVKPSRREFDEFQRNLQKLITQIHSNLNESEEFHKNNLANLFNNSFYHPHHYINTKEKHDLVIHNGKTSQSSVGVIIETKSPTNSHEMISFERFNSKALQQLLLYYLQERVTNQNLELKHLIITNCLDFYVFSAQTFEGLFYQNKSLIKQFDDFNNKRLVNHTRDFFYQNIAKNAIDLVENELKQDCVYFSLNNYQEQIDEKELIILYKFFSPQHLLKQPFTNDSNSLDQGFYSELLHIIGLAEVKQGSKKVIDRLPENLRLSSSLLENTINQLDISEKIHYLNNPDDYGDSYDERLFKVALELVITWVNRILFLKLLEAQLIRYNSHFNNSLTKDFSFLHSDFIGNFNELESLFFQVLAKQVGERKLEIQSKFAHIPYLNSSLFEVTSLERETIGISSLNYQVELNLYSHTVLKDSQGKPLTQPQKTLDYFFNFLSAYDFSSEGSLEIQEDNKTLINASVLGLIFEKINGYQDGSYFTPGFITMYMCRETIRRAIIHKFNELKGWQCTTIDDLYDKIDDKQDANVIINSIKICDPAVGSGHFLVSALNEIIALKSELNILLDRHNKTIKKTDYLVTVENDELIVIDEDNQPFAYNPNNAKSRRIQEALFHEKQVIIENCLFGVDININSVKICRLRLWIELLKNAYYIIDDSTPFQSALKENLIPPNPPSKKRKKSAGFSCFPLQTLPNIDINIKCGNSLISRFELRDSISSPRVKRQIGEYKDAVKAYRNPQTKQEKLRVERVIDEIKSSIRSDITGVDAISIRLRQLEGELNGLLNQTSLFAETAKEVKARAKRQKQLEKDINKLRLELEDKRDNRIFLHGFEWRFEFPEILDDNGDFLGFDIIIGNPPYIRQEAIKEFKAIFSQQYQCYTGVADLFVYFYEQGLNLIKADGYLSYITSNKWFRAGYGEKLRSYFAHETTIELIIDFGDADVFEVIAYPSIILAKKTKPILSDDTVTVNNKKQFSQVKVLNWGENKSLNELDFIYDKDHFLLSQYQLTADGWRFELPKVLNLLDKIKNAGTPLGEYINNQFFYGIKTGFNEAFIVDKETRDKLINEHFSSAEVLKPLIRGRDVKRWVVNFADQYLIKIESSENKQHLWSNLPDGEAEEVFAQVYPAIYNRFNQYRDQLQKRTDQGKYFWELRSCAYYNEFEQSKIIYPDIASYSQFSWDNNNYFLVNTLYLIPANSKYILGVLNSKIVFWIYTNISSSIRGGFVRFIAQYISQIPIPKASEKKKKEIEKLVQKCLDAKGVNVGDLERKIDEMVYELYGLTAEEVEIINE